MMKKIRFFAALSALLAFAILPGCDSLLSGTFVIDYMVYDIDITSGSEWDLFQVDLTDEDVWKDHKDEIKNIDNVGVELWITNPTTGVQTAELYITDYDNTGYVSATAIRQNTDVVFDNLSAAPQTQTHIDWSTSLGHVTDLNKLQTYAELGRFAVYTITTTLPYAIEIDSARVIVTVTVKK